MTYSYREIQGIVVVYNELKIPRVKSIALAVLNNPAYFLNPVFLKRDDGAEVILLKLDIEIYQNPLNGIEEQEDVAIVCYSEDEYFPEVYALRGNFQLGLPHTNLRIEKYPVSLCVSEEDFQETKHKFNSFEFIESIRRWMSLTSLGKLHADDQPLEPFFRPKGYVVFSENDKVDFANFHLEKYSTNSTLLRIQSKENYEDLYFCEFVSCDEQVSGFIHSQPKILADLIEIISINGVDISTFLTKKFNENNQNLLASKKRLEKKLAILCSIPVKRNISDENSEKTDYLFFITRKSVKEIAIENGVWGESLDKKNLVQIVGQLFHKEYFDQVELDLYSLIDDFNRKTTTTYNNVQLHDSRFTWIGAGALGSQVLALYARMGYGFWTIIDYDTLMPHNLARHFLNREDVGFTKVAKLSEKLNMLVGDEFCNPINANFIKAHKSEEIITKLKGSKAIIDVSTSIAVERVLARDLSNVIFTRRISAFLNPSGQDLIVLAEDVKRKYCLDFLEMEYYRFLFRNEKLNDHLNFDEGSKIRYNRNSCREISSRINQIDVALLASICAKAIINIVEHHNASISIWRIDPNDYTVELFSTQPTKWAKFSVNGWKIYFNASLLDEIQTLRQKKLPNETGGVLLGSIDTQREIIYIYDTIPAPEDSKETASSFERGKEGVLGEYEKYQKITDRQIQYLGEWHSHPKKCSTEPSSYDMNVFVYLHKRLSRQGYPTVMGIIGDSNCSITVSC